MRPPERIYGPSASKSALDDIFELQDQVTEAVVGAIAPQLERAEIERAKRKPTESLDAYDYYLRGMAHLHLGSRESIDAALEQGYTVILSSTDGHEEREREILLALQSRMIDGMVVASASLRDSSVRWLREHDVPHVLVNRYSDQKDYFVGTDDKLGARLATEHLLALGHRRIAHLAGPQRISTAVDRRRGYEEALNIFTVTAMGSGNRKSAVFREVAGRKYPRASNASLRMNSTRLP